MDGARWVQIGDEIPPPQALLTPHLEAVVAAQAERVAGETGTAGPAARASCAGSPVSDFASMLRRKNLSA